MSRVRVEANPSPCGGKSGPNSGWICVHTDTSSRVRLVSGSGLNLGRISVHTDTRRTCRALAWFLARGRTSATQPPSTVPIYFHVGGIACQPPNLLPCSFLMPHVRWGAPSPLPSFLPPSATSCPATLVVATLGALDAI